MGDFVRLIFTPFLYAWKWSQSLFWGLLCLFIMAVGVVFYRVKEDADELAEGAEDDAAIAYVQSEEENEDRLRRHLADCTVERIPELIQQAYGEQIFQPSTPFIPWWEREQRRKREL